MRVFAYQTVGLIIILLLCLLCSCTTTQYVPVETVKIEKETVHDTVYKVKTVHLNDCTSVEKQSLLQEVDSSCLKQLGIINPPAKAWMLHTSEKKIEKKTQAESDTTKQITNRDSSRIEYIQLPYPVEKKLTKWQQAKVDWGGWAMLTVVVIVLFIIVWLVNKRLQR